MVNVSFEDFQKIELKVAKILEAEKVEGSEKLIKLRLDLGPSTSSGQASEKRQIVAGIGRAYNPEDLAGKEIVIAANLEPRVLFGIESRGMLLAAHNGKGQPILLVPEREVPPGAKVS